MPVYEYQCTACGAVVEVMQKFSDAPLKRCKACKKHTMKKLMGTPALQFKGSGWYITDYAGKNAGNSGTAKPEKSDTPAAAPACACNSGSCGTK